MYLIEQLIDCGCGTRVMTKPWLCTCSMYIT